MKKNPSTAALKSHNSPWVLMPRTSLLCAFLVWWNTDVSQVWKWFPTTPLFTHGGEILTPSCQAEPVLCTKASFHAWPCWNAWSRTQHSPGLSSQACERERCWRCEKGSMWALAYLLKTTNDLLERLKGKKMKRKKIWLCSKRIWLFPFDWRWKHLMAPKIK